MAVFVVPGGRFRAGDGGWPSLRPTGARGAGFRAQPAYTRKTNRTEGRAEVAVVGLAAGLEPDPGRRDEEYAIRPGRLPRRHRHAGGWLTGKASPRQARRLPPGCRECPARRPG